MDTSKKKSGRDNRIAYQEFGTGSQPNAATERPVTELPPSEQKIRVQASRKGRKGKTVTEITGFQLKPETLSDLAKQLKSKCGTGGTVKDNTIEMHGDCKQKVL